MTIGRRRFIALTAFAAGSAMLPIRAALAQDPAAWRGNALGADASLEIFGVDAALGRRLIGESLAELERLERILSLYRDDSALVRLNRQGRLDDPPAELVEMLTFASHWSARTAGAFDVTVQPLWELHEAHFSSPGADPRGPSDRDVAEARRLVDWRGVLVESNRILFDRPGMKVTLNSIGQGYVTDKVALLLRRRGMRHVLVDMGEISAIGTKPDGSPWRVGLERGGEVEIADRAVATSSPDGTRFSPFCHHIFDPRTGRSSHFDLAASVVAGNAATANAISTSVCVGGPEMARRLGGGGEQIYLAG